MTTAVSRVGEMNTEAHWRLTSQGTTESALHGYSKCDTGAGVGKKTMGQLPSSSKKEEELRSSSVITRKQQQKIKQKMAGVMATRMSRTLHRTERRTPIKHADCEGCGGCD